jgi:hypothetical protein
VQLVYGSQLQRPDDETAANDPLDVASMTREERDRLKRQLLADHPELADPFAARHVICQLRKRPMPHANTTTE